MRALSLIAALALASAAFAQQTPRDFTISITSPNPTGIATGFFEAALAVESNLTTKDIEPFTVRLTVPAAIEITSACGGNTAWDPQTRTFTWSDLLDNPLIAHKACPMTFRVGPSVPSGTVFTLVATLFTPNDVNPDNNRATRLYAVIAVSNVEAKSSADPPRLRPGATLAYTLTVTNHGPHDAQSVVIVDQLSPDVDFVSFEMTDGPPAVVDPLPYHASGQCSSPRCGTYVQANIGILAAGSSATFRLVVKVKSSFETAIIDNRLTIETSSPDRTFNDNRADLQVFAGPRADLAIVEKTELQNESGQIPITLEVSNQGPDSANAVTVRNMLEGRAGHYDFLERVRFVKATPSQGTCADPHVIWLIGSPNPPPMWGLDCNLGTLAPGAKATISLTTAKSLNAGRFDYTASVNPDHNDPSPSNNRTVLPVNLRPRKHATKR